VKADAQKHIKKYLLRSKLNFSSIDGEFNTWQAWGPSTAQLWGSYVEKPIAPLPVGMLVPRGSIN
jgi:hypothetical protein